MTTVTYFEQNDEMSIEIKGHAGHNKKGEDVVCSAISMLGQTLLSYLNVDHDKFNYSMKDGLIWAYAKGINVRTALNVVMTGYYLLETNYPEHVKIIRGCCIQQNPEDDITKIGS